MSAQPPPLFRNYPSVEAWADAFSRWMSDNNIDLEALARKNPPIGAQVAYPSATMPAGWLDCDGASYPRTRYPQLAKVIGGGGATFTVPNVAGEIIRAE